MSLSDYWRQLKRGFCASEMPGQCPVARRLETCWLAAGRLSHFYRAGGRISGLDEQADFRIRSEWEGLADLIRLRLLPLLLTFNLPP